MNTSTVIDVSAAQSERRERASTAIVPAADTTPMQVLYMAVQRGVDPETLRKMMDLQERWEANEARKAFAAAVSAAKAEIKPIVKRHEVDFTSQKGRTRYKHEGLDDIAEEVDPVLAKHGLSYRHRSKQDGKHLTITCVLEHCAGHAEEISLTADNDESGNKNSIQAIGSTATLLQRYTLKLALGLATTKDDDGRSAGAGNSVATNKQQPPAPEGYADWKKSMETVATKGSAALREAWAKASGFRGYAGTIDVTWWNELKDTAAKVPQGVAK